MGRELKLLLSCESSQNLLFSISFVMMDTHMPTPNQFLQILIASQTIDLNHKYFILWAIEASKNSRAKVLQEELARLKRQVMEREQKEKHELAAKLLREQHLRQFSNSVSSSEQHKDDEAHRTLKVGLLIPVLSAKD